MESLRFPAAVFVKFSFSYGNISSMDSSDFRNQFIQLIKLLFSMQHVDIQQMYVPNGEYISITVKSGLCCLELYRGSFRIYRFHCNKNIENDMEEKLGHVGFASTYLYNTNKSGEDQRKILDGLKMEAVKQV
jgi:hypothetical protein